MNLTTFRSRISFATGLSNIASSAEQALIDGWVNEAVIQFLLKTKINVQQFNVTLTAGEDSYTVDDDILAWKELWIESASGMRLIRPATAQEIFRRKTLGGGTGAWPVIYSMQGHNLLLIHPPAQASTDKLHGLYVPLPVALTTGAHDPSEATRGGIPVGYHPALEAYATMRAAAADDKTTGPSFKDYEAEWNAAIIAAKIEVNKKTGVLWAPARPAHREWPYAPTPGTDLGW